MFVVFCLSSFISTGASDIQSEVGLETLLGGYGLYGNNAHERMNDLHLKKAK